MEHRWAKEKRITRCVSFTAGGIAAPGYIINMSVSGSFVWTLPRSSR
jgi:hypothetical protein